MYGSTQATSAEGLLVFDEPALNPGIPMSREFGFGENACSLNISGQVMFCRSVEKNEATSKKAIGIKFSAIREFEQKILTSAVQELKLSPETHQKSLLDILVSTDTMAQEAAGFSIRTSKTLY